MGKRMMVRYCYTLHLSGRLRQEDPKVKTSWAIYIEGRCKDREIVVSLVASRPVLFGSIFSPSTTQTLALLF